jgi:uracil phosphoribosyltransferase
VRATIPPPPAVPVEPAPAAPRLSQIFTAEQLREYNRTLEDSLDRVRKVLGTVASKNLNSEQTQVVQRIQTFQKQAEQAREQDLVTAVNLARRADLLAQDLIKRLP